MVRHQQQSTTTTQPHTTTSPPLPPSPIPTNDGRILTGSHSPVISNHKQIAESTLPTSTITTNDAPMTTDTEQKQPVMDLTAYAKLSKRKRTEIGVNALQRAQTFVGKSHITHTSKMKNLAHRG